MKELTAVFGGATPVLPHITWPIAPYDDESLAGFTARACAYNGLWDATVLVADAGLRLPKGFGHLPRVSRDLSALATLLAVDPLWIENRRHLTVRTATDTKSRCVDFHGAILRRVHFNYTSRRVAPTAIVEQGYHREIWHIFTIPACGRTGELLVDRCQQPGCGKALGWAGRRGIGHCADIHCAGSMLSLVPDTVSEADRLGLALAAGLIGPSSAINATVLASLPEGLRDENRGDLFELAWLLGCLDFEEGSTAIMSPANVPGRVRSKLLSRGANRLLRWPICLTDVLRTAATGDNPATAVKRVVETVRAIVRKPTTFGRPAALIGNELEGISSTAYSTVVGRRLGLLTATEFARVAGIRTSRMAVLQRSPHLSRLLFSGGGRDIALFSPTDAEEVRRRIEARLPAQAYSSDLGLGMDAVEQLVGEKVLFPAHDPIIKALWPEPHLDRFSATDLQQRIMCRLSRASAPDGSIKLSEALYGCAAGDKPWSAIIDALLAGHLSLHHTGAKLNFRSCLIGQHDVRKLHSLRASKPCGAIRSEWLSEVDACERLSTSGRRLRSLFKAGKLSNSGLFSGLTYRRSEIDTIAAAWVSTFELQAKLGLSRWRDLSAMLRAVGLAADEHGLVPRLAAHENLGLLLV